MRGDNGQRERGREQEQARITECQGLAKNQFVSENDKRFSSLFFRWKNWDRLKKSGEDENSLTGGKPQAEAEVERGGESGTCGQQVCRAGES